jgi:hypothetical protein
MLPKYGRQGILIVRSQAKAPFDSDEVSLPLEKLYRPFVLFRRTARFESAQIAAFTGRGIFLARIKTVFPGCEFPNHDPIPVSWRPS